MEIYKQSLPTYTYYVLYILLDWEIRLREYENDGIGIFYWIIHSEQF